MSSKIKIEDFSNGSIKSSVIDGINHHEWQGTAIFDVLMQSVNSNLKIQFDNGRIIGPDYAQVYMASIQSCITEAMKYLLNKDLVDAQILQVEAQTAQVNAETGKVAVEISKIEADKNYINLQASLYSDTVAKDLAVKDAQITKLGKETGLVEKEISNFDVQASKDLLVKEAQIQKTNADKDYIQVQSDAYPASASKELELKQAQISKLTSDKNLVDAQKTAYPAQQAKDIEVKQANIDLLNRQKEGFDDNKYQKLFEAQMNAWALMFSSGLLTDKPTIISNDSASSLYNTLKP